MSRELARETDQAICRILGTSEHDEAVAALGDVMSIREAGGDSVTVLAVLAATSAIAKWESLLEKLGDTAEMIGQTLPGGARADGSEHDTARLSAGGYVSMFRMTRARDPEGATRYPADVAACLRDYTAKVVEWLKDEQRRCGQEVPLMKHDRFVRLCHKALYGEEPPAHVLAIDSRQGARQGR